MWVGSVVTCGMPTAETLKYLEPSFISGLKTMEMKARLIVEGFITGLHQSPYHGFSVEFAEHRPYNPGESLRNIDWRVFGKTDRLYTKRYEEETNLRCYIALDVSDSMRYPQRHPNRLPKLEYGAYLAAALGWLMVQQRDAVGLTLFDDAIRYSTPAKAKTSWLLPLFAELEKTVANTEVFTHRTATASVLHQLGHQIGRRGLVVLITDLFSPEQPIEELFPALQRLRHANHEVIVFQLLDHETEALFEFGNIPLVLKDLETGEELKVQPEHIRQAYQTQMQAYVRTIKRRLQELNIDFFEIDIAKPYTKALTDYLIKRHRLV